MGVVGLLLLTSGELAAAPSVRLTVDRTEAYVGDPLELAVEVENGESDVPELVAPEGFELQYRGQSSSMQIINGRSSSQISFGYNLVPTTPGDKTVGPAVVTVGGQTLRSNTVTVRVMGNGSRTQPAADDQIFL